MLIDMRAPTPSLLEVIETVLTLVRDYTGKPGEGWNSATTLEQAGIDSLAFVELLIAIEDHFGICPSGTLRPADALIATIEDLARFVRSSLRVQEDLLVAREDSAGEGPRAVA